MRLLPSTEEKWTPVNALYTLVILGAATGNIALFLAKSPLLNSFHDWLDKDFPLIGKLYDCPWCLSHYLAAFFMFVYHPVLLDSGPYWLDWFASWMVMVLVAVVVARLIYSSLKGFEA